MLNYSTKAKVIISFVFVEFEANKYYGCPLFCDEGLKLAV